MTVVFSEPVANLGNWSIVSGGPAGATLGAPVLGGTTSTVVIPVNGAAIDTDGAFRVSASGVDDTFGNAFSGTVNLTDARKPRADVRDDVVARAPVWRAPGTSSPSTSRSRCVAGSGTTLVLTNNGGNDTISVPGFLNAASSTGGNYNDPNGNGGNAATFAVTQVTSGNQVTLNLSACTPTNNCDDLSTVSGTPTLGLVFAPSWSEWTRSLAQLPTAPLAALLF